MRLAIAGVPTPDVDAELLVLHATGWTRTERILYGSEELAPRVQTALEAAVTRREQREPLQLIVGSVGFRHLDIHVQPGVFIPRPETEVLVDHAVREVPAGGVVVEPCTGTGAVACAIARESAALVLATDISPEACALTRKNAAHNEVEVTVLRGDLLAPLARELRGRVDVVVSNPPYLADGELAACEREVRAWDPPAALVSGPTGHELSDRLIAESLEWLHPRGLLVLEVDTQRAQETAQRALVAGYSQATVHPDLTGTDRVVVARR